MFDCCILPLNHTSRAHRNIAPTTETCTQAVEQGPPEPTHVRPAFYASTRCAQMKLVGTHVGCAAARMALEARIQAEWSSQLFVRAISTQEVCLDHDTQYTTRIGCGYQAGHVRGVSYLQSLVLGRFGGAPLFLAPTAADRGCIRGGLPGPFLRCLTADRRSAQSDAQTTSYIACRLRVLLKVHDDSRCVHGEVVSQRFARKP